MSPPPGSTDPGPSPSGRRTPPPETRAAKTRRRNRADQLVRIYEQNPREAGSVGMSPSMFVQAMLPHSEVLERGPDGDLVLDRNGDPVRARAYQARNGDFTLTVRAGLDRNGQSVGVPYGGRARLLVTYFCSEARKRYGLYAGGPADEGALDPAAFERARHVDLGETMSSFMRELDIEPTGGERGNIGYLTDQLRRLATCVVSFEWDHRSANLYGRRRDMGGEHVLIVQRYHLWDAPPLVGPDGQELGEGASGGSLVLQEEFLRQILLSSFPIDFRKLQYLRAHPLALDLYLWCTYNAERLARAGRTQKVVAWRSLHGQLGAHYGESERGLKDFGYRARKALKKVRECWPALDYETPRGRLVLLTTTPDVPHR